MRKGVGSARQPEYGLAFTSEDPVTPYRRKGFLKPLSVLVVLLLIVVAGIGVYELLNDRLSTRPLPSNPLADGPTLLQALSIVQPSVVLTPGGPWTLFSVYGVAAKTPFSPNVVSNMNQNRTVNNCGHLFDGLTMWNGSLPVFNGSFDSGTAPFWQLAFYSNATEQVLLATVVNGTSKIYVPTGLYGACMPWPNFPSRPDFWTSVFPLLGVDSSVAARAAWNAVGPTAQKTPEPIAEIIQIGPGVLNVLGDAIDAYQINFLRCGQAGIAGGDRPLQVAGVNPLNGSHFFSFVGTMNCALQFGDTPSDGLYRLLFTPVELVGDSLTSWATASFQVAFASPNGTLTSFRDGWGLANWMTSLNLTTSTGQPLPLASSTCAAWVRSVADCHAASSGWYAVLLSSYGDWIDSYGDIANGRGGWSRPVDSMVSNQQLVIVAPATWNLTGDRLVVNSTVSSSVIQGTAVL